MLESNEGEVDLAVQTLENGTNLFGGALAAVIVLAVLAGLFLIALIGACIYIVKMKKGPAHEGENHKGGSNTMINPESGK